MSYFKGITISYFANLKSRKVDYLMKLGILIMLLVLQVMNQI